mgnify:CR=1 FL=1
METAKAMEWATDSAEAARARDGRRWQEWQSQKGEALAYLEGKVNKYLPCPEYGRMPNPPDLGCLFDYLDPPEAEVNRYGVSWRSAEKCDASLERAVKAIWAQAEQAEKTMWRVAECTKCRYFFRCAALSGWFQPVVSAGP